MTTPKIKSPGRVQAGIRRQEQLRAQLGDQGYSAYQRERRNDALARYPDLQQRAAAAGNAAQRAAWGTEGYRAQRCDAYAIAIERYGREIIHRYIRAAHEERRRHRLSHPTRGEALLRSVAASFGFQIILPQTPFDYLAWLANPTIWPDVGNLTAVAEATIGRYACDVLFPVKRTIVEVLGGVHCLQQEQDARRRAELAQYGLTIIELNDTDEEPLTELRVRVVLQGLLRTTT